MEYIKTSISVPRELLKRVRKYNKKHPEHKINVSGATQSVLKTLLELYKEV